MTFDLKKSFTYMREDKQFREKLLSGTFLVMLCNCLGAYSSRHGMAFNLSGKGHQLSPLVFPAFLAFWVLVLFLWGYFIKNLQNRLNTASVALPELNEVKDHLQSGIKLGAGNFAIGLPFVLIVALVFSIFPFIYSNLSISIANFIQLILSFVIILVVALYFCVYTLQDIIFAKDMNFASLFNFKKGFANLKNGFKSYALIALSGFILTALSVFLVYWAKMGQSESYLLTILVSIPNFYLALVYGDILAQWAKGVQN